MERSLLKITKVHKIGSSKITPFRQNTINYTGGIKNPSRDFEFSDIIQMKGNVWSLFNQLIERMNSFIASKFLVDSAHNFTQFIRGELFIVIDFILSFQKSPSPSDMPHLVEIIDKFLELANYYLVSLHLYMKEVQINSE